MSKFGSFFDSDPGSSSGRRQNQIPTTAGHPAATDPKPNLKSRLHDAKNRYSNSAVAHKARKLLFNVSRGGLFNPLLTASEIPIDRYLPTEIHLQIFSYLPWESQLACSLASRIWEEILWNHGQDSGLFSGDERYSPHGKRLMYHRFFYRRTCELGVRENGIETIGWFGSVSPWKQAPAAQRRVKQRRRPHSSSSSSSSEVSTLDDGNKKPREMVYIDPHRSFIMNDRLLTPNQNAYGIENSRFESRFSRHAYLRNKAESDDGDDGDDQFLANPRLQTHTRATIYSIIIVRIGSSIHGSKFRNSTTWSLLPNDGEGITVRMFLEHIVRLVKENGELEELKGDQMTTVRLRVQYVGARNVTFLVHVEGYWVIASLQEGF